MTDGVNVDWGLLKQPDYVGDYANAFQVGRQEVQQQLQAPPSVNAFDTGAARVPSSAPATLDAQIGSLDDPGRAHAAQQAELLESLGAGLKRFALNGSSQDFINCRSSASSKPFGAIHRAKCCWVIINSVQVVRGDAED